ncbi:hypothetical protein PUN28_014543 [Cardiocondyla obscurior]|uniref:Uncharacterized protein n=1 Tax=Cardiocondyla obscurior TaxID=286306 RepID=A0AAW2F3U2_9HYME
MLHGLGGPYGVSFYPAVGFPTSVNDATFLAVPRKYDQKKVFNHDGREITRLAPIFSRLKDDSIFVLYLCNTSASKVESMKNGV